MSDLFNNCYRIASTRLPGWDYSAGWYFITVCTHGRTPWLSTVTGDDVRLSPIGMIVADEWQRTAVVRPYVTLDAWVVMPDHFHAIIGIHPVGDNGVNAFDDAIDVETPRRGVSTMPASPSPSPSPSPPSPPSPPSSPSPPAMRSLPPSSPSPPAMRSSPVAAPTLRAGSLGAIVGQWTSAATKRIRADRCADFAWQPRFSAVILRDAATRARTRRYIANNPRRWTQRRIW